MTYYALTVPGVEGLLAREIADGGGHVSERRSGVVFFEWYGDAPTLLRLGLAEDVFALVAREEVSLKKDGLRQIEALVQRAPSWERSLDALYRTRPRRGQRMRFRVVVQRRSGGQRYVRKVVEQRVYRAIAQRFPTWKAVQEDAALEAWILEEKGEVLCGVRLSDRTMRHRTYKKSNIAASLRPVVARALVTMTKPGPKDVFLDPMCGAGTLLIERGECGRYQQLLGGDIRPEALAAARSNIGPRYKPIELRSWNACDLPIEAGSVNSIACNLPFGNKVGQRSELADLYARFVPEARRVLVSGSAAVLLTSERALLESAVRDGTHFYCERMLSLTVLGQRASAFVMRAF